MDEEMVVGADVGVSSEAEEAPQVETPEVEGGVPDGTPAQEPQNDANPQLAKLQEDLNRYKSAAQRREYELSQQFTAREDFYRQQMAQMQREAYERATQGMDMDERRVYDQQLQQQQANQQREYELQQLRATVEHLSQGQQIAERQKQTIEFLNWMTGLPPEELAKHLDPNDPTPVLMQARNYVADLKKKASKQPPEPPKVSTGRSGASATGVLAKWGKMTPEERNAFIERENIPLSDLR